MRRCALSADWPAGESCVPEEAAGDAPSAPTQGGDGRRLQGKKGDTNRKEKGGLWFLVGPNVYQAELRHGAWRDSVATMHVARLSLATSAAWPRAFQRGSLIAPRSLARSKGLSFGNLDLHELLLKY